VSAGNAAKKENPNMTASIIASAAIALIFAADAAPVTSVAEAAAAAVEFLMETDEAVCRFLMAGTAGDYNALLLSVEAAAEFYV
jgi:hypothetical protein